ncbi:MAG TPA: hypothetical protein VF331_15925 [Polyangiales bacterium]
MKQSELMELFLRLDAPSMTNMNGEFRGHLLDQGAFRLIKVSLAYFALRAPFVNGRWQGKGFTTTSNDEGHGYNRYLQHGRDSYILPMKTKIAKSVLDGRACFELDYTAYGSQAGLVNMIDEVRKVNDELYLGIGFCGYSRQQRRIPFFFALSGPRRPFASVSKPKRERQRKFSRYE